jgi:hypothetical protein
MPQITEVGVGLASRVIQVHAIAACGRIALARTTRRAGWRRLAPMGRCVKLVKFVKFGVPAPSAIEALLTQAAKKSAFMRTAHKRRNRLARWVLQRKERGLTASGGSTGQHARIPWAVLTKGRVFGPTDRAQTPISA